MSNHQKIFHMTFLYLCLPNCSNKNQSQHTHQCASRPVSTLEQRSRAVSILAKSSLAVVSLKFPAIPLNQRGTKSVDNPHLTPSLMPEHIRQHFLCKTCPHSAEDAPSLRLTWGKMMGWIGEVWKVLASSWMPAHYTNMRVFFLPYSFRGDQL